MERIGKWYKTVVGFALILLCQACGKDSDPNVIQPYEGPLMEIMHMETLYSDSAVVRVRVQAERQLEFQDGNSEFPDGIFIEFFDINGEISSTLRADRGYFNQKEKLYTGRGDVEVMSYENGQKLNTEELHWKQDKAEIYTDKFVRIETADEILMGEGLTASQDFSNYRILKPTGELGITQ